MDRGQGFSLLELIMALGILALLTSIAYPVYSEQVRQGRRAQVGSLLLENAHLLERHYLRHGSYAAGTVAGLQVQSPPQGNALFRIQVSRSEHGFLLEADAVAGSLMADDPCARYTLDQTGQRTPADDKCWRR